jgi:formate hydrogenlyase subunit 3/multisubunit Na+/H+ antiporter MnhD subunit
VSVSPVDTLLWCVLGLLGLAGVSVILGRRPWATGVVYGASVALCVAMLAQALASLLGVAAGTSETVLPLGLPWVGAHFRLDALASVFLAVIALGGAIASLYAIGYGAHETAPERVLPFYPAFLAGMTLVVLAADAFSFLVAWEFMSLSSWALVMSRHREPGTAHAGYVYLLMASLGAMCLLLGFGLLAGPAGAYDFASIRAHPPTAGVAAAVLALAVLGAGSKAGLVPLHVWLPLAHPAAPSHVSALMSGVMTKVAVYAFIRLAFTLMGPPAWWWSLVVLALGAATAALGVLYALMQQDLKRLLAYSSVENIGIIFIGLGLALAFRAQHLDWAAALAVTAALFHVFNHSLFKSLLFLGSGAVLSATGERDMDRLGGLIRTMPQTAVVFLVGCVAISALPPLNGFVSEWMTLQAILISPRLDAWALKLMAPAVGALLALSTALAAACFVRAYGVTFLGRPRSEVAGRAAEIDPWSRAAMVILAGLCLLAGVLPAFVIDALAPAARSLVDARMPGQASQAWLTIVPVAESRSSYNGLLVLIFIAASASLMAMAIHRLASRAWRRSPAWDCGYPDPSPSTQYTAGSFAQPIRRVFGSVIFRARDQVDFASPGDPRPARFTAVLHDPVWEDLYAPVVWLVGRLADRLNRLQFMTIRFYLSLVFLALVALLMVVALWL